MCGAVADLEDGDELVLRAVEGAHAGVGLDPDAQILERELRRAACHEQFIEMAPVHADEGDGAIGAVGADLFEGGREEGRELVFRHLARGHRELGVLDLPESRHVAVDRHIIRRVGEHHLRLLALRADGHTPLAELHRRRAPDDDRAARGPRAA